jgi:hypothetical protein
MLLCILVTLQELGHRFGLCRIAKKKLMTIPPNWPLHHAICLLGSSDLAGFRAILEASKSESISLISAQNKVEICKIFLHRQPICKRGPRRLRSCILVSDGDQSRLFISNSARLSASLNAY